MTTSKHSIERRHACAVCPAPIRHGFLMCARHWRLVPHSQQEAVYSTWGRYQRSPKQAGFGAIARAQYFEARDIAIASARALISTTPPTGDSE